MIKLQIYQFPFFGEFAELLANSNLLPVLLNEASKIFFLNSKFFILLIYNSIHVQRDYGVFFHNILFWLCKNCLKFLFFTLFYLPRYYTRQVITCRIINAESKVEFANNSANSPKYGKL